MKSILLPILASACLSAIASAVFTHGQSFFAIGVSAGIAALFGASIAFQAQTFIESVVIAGIAVLLATTFPGNAPLLVRNGFVSIACGCVVGAPFGFWVHSIELSNGYEKWLENHDANGDFETPEEN